MDGRGTAPPLPWRMEFGTLNYNLHKYNPSANTSTGGMRMKQNEKREEKAPVPWEMKDPKPPVVRSGHMESHRENKNNPS